MTSPVTDSLQADLARLNAARGGHTCHTLHALSKLDSDDSAAVLAAMDTPVSSADLARLLNRYTGASLTGTQVARHRRRGQANGCKCPRDGDGTSA